MCALKSVRQQRFILSFKTSNPSKTEKLTMYHSVSSQRNTVSNRQDVIHHGFSTYTFCNLHTLKRLRFVRFPYTSETRFRKKKILSFKKPVDRLIIESCLIFLVTAQRPPDDDGPCDRVFLCFCLCIFLFIVSSSYNPVVMLSFKALYFVTIVVFYEHSRRVVNT